MRRLGIAFAVFALMSLVSTVAVGPAHAQTVPGTGQGSLMISHDQPSGVRGYGLDVNGSLLFLNAGLMVRHWDHDVTAGNGKRLQDEGAVYIGIGLLHLIQFQKGYSNAGTRNRIRSDIFFGEDFPFPGPRGWGPFSKGLVLSPFMETGSGKKVYGLGIGLSFD